MPDVNLNFLIEIANSSKPYLKEIIISNQLKINVLGKYLENFILVSDNNFLQKISSQAFANTFNDAFVDIENSDLNKLTRLFFVNQLFNSYQHMVMYLSLPQLELALLESDEVEEVYVNAFSSIVSTQKISYELYCFYSQLAVFENIKNLILSSGFLKKS